MKRLLWLVALLWLCACPTQAQTISNTPTCNRTTGSTTGASASVTVAAGDALAFGVSWAGATTVSSVDDTGAQTYTAAPAGKATQVTPNSEWFTFANSASGTITTTAHMSGSTSEMWACLYVIHGAATSSIVNTDSTAVFGSSPIPNPVSGAAVTTTSANVVLLAIGASDGNTTSTMGGGFTGDFGSGAGSIIDPAIGHDIVSSTSTYTPTFSGMTGDNAAFATIAIKAAGVAAPISGAVKRKKIEAQQ